MVFKRYAEANNKIQKSYNANKPASCITYLNANNLYVHSMLQLSSTEILGQVNHKDFNLGNLLF